MSLSTPAISKALEFTQAAWHEISNRKMGFSALIPLCLSASSFLRHRDRVGAELNVLLIGDCGAVEKVAFAGGHAAIGSKRGFAF